MKNKLPSLGISRNLFIAISVLFLTIFSIGVSYASFFSVKTNTNNQSITTGTLSVSFDSESSSSITKQSLAPVSDEMGMNQSESNVVYIQNTGNLNSVFTLNVGYNISAFTSRSGYQATDKLTPIDYIMFAVYEHANNTDTLVAGPISMADLPIYTFDSSDHLNNRYSLLVGNIGSTSSGSAAKTYKVKAWLSDKAIPAVSYSYFYLNMEVVAEVEHAKMAYDLSGTITDGTNALNGAILSFHNGSQIVTTSSNGNWTLNDVYPGVYNVDITYNDVVYSGNLTVIEENNRTAASLSSMGTTFSGTDLWANANAYGTTVGKIIKYNEISGYSDDITLSGTLNLQSSYKIQGGSIETVSGINIILDTTNETYTMSIS